MTTDNKVNLDKPALKYKPEYCKLVFEHMANGFTISSFQVEPPVRQKTIFAWVHDHEEFALAIEKGRAKFLKRLEVASNIKTFGLKIPEDQKDSFGKIDGEMLRFRLTKQFRHEYGDKIDVAHTGEVITKINFIEMPGREDKKPDPIKLKTPEEIEAEELEAIRRSDEERLQTFEG